MSINNATPHFKWSEFYCPLAQYAPVSDLALHHLDKLEQLRTDIDMPLRVNSGYRSPKHNQLVGGAEMSMHLEFASDLTPLIHADQNLMEWLIIVATNAEKLGFSGIGKYNNFVHLDCRTFIGRKSAQWDNRS